METNSPRREGQGEGEGEGEGEGGVAVSSRDALLASLDYVHFAAPDINGIPRGRVVPARYVRDALTNGIELFHGTLLFGPRSEPADQIPELEEEPGNATWLPDPNTLQPTPWSDSDSAGTRGGRRRTGMVLCDVLKNDAPLRDFDSRAIVRRLLRDLEARHGLVVKVAFEYEFVVYHKDTLKPLGNDHFQLLDLRTTQPDLDLLCELSEELSRAGLHVTSVQPEFAPGQWELNFDPQEGLWAADFAFHVKNAVKVFFARRGYVASFMSYPRLGGAGNGLHLNHSLWTLDGRNAMKDETKPDTLSDVALMWNAGLLRHAGAMADLSCPTVNCYRRLHLPGCPSTATWALDNRNALNRFKTSKGNVYLESRLPSGAASPYLTLACHLAAGLSGLGQEVTSLPPPLDVQHARKLPTSLQEAFEALENDDVIKSGLGAGFVSHYLAAKRDYELGAFSKQTFKTDEEKIEFERGRYLLSL